MSLILLQQTPHAMYIVHIPGFFDLCLHSNTTFSVSVGALKYSKSNFLLHHSIPIWCCMHSSVTCDNFSVCCMRTTCTDCTQLWTHDNGGCMLLTTWIHHMVLFLHISTYIYQQLHKISNTRIIPSVITVYTWPTCSEMRRHVRHNSQTCEPLPPLCIPTHNINYWNGVN